MRTEFMNQDCLNCKSACCMAEKSFSAVISDREMATLRAAVEADKSLLETVGKNFAYYDKNAKAYKTRSLENGWCVFWNPENCACRIYEIRPLDCKIFPFEYRWFRWIRSPQCPAKNFKKKSVLGNLKQSDPKEIRALKLMHINTPESTKDKLWIFLIRTTPTAKLYALYAFLMDAAKRRAKKLHKKRKA